VSAAGWPVPANLPPVTCRPPSALSSRPSAALSDAAELTIDQNAHEVIAGWRATARIKADKGYAQALAPTEGDFGPAEVTG
jgi:hypothetical protein